MNKEIQHVMTYEEYQQEINDVTEKITSFIEQLDPFEAIVAPALMRIYVSLCMNQRMTSEEFNDRLRRLAHDYKKKLEKSANE